MVYNPSLREEPIDQPASVIPIKQETSILDWLESSGRLLARDEKDPDNGDFDDEEEIEQLMGGDEMVYDEDDLDDDIAEDIE